MATDVYIKFGDSGDKGGPGPTAELLNLPLPDIEGDSSDLKHWYWCELRDCGFDMTGPPQDTESGDSSGSDPQAGSQSTTAGQTASAKFQPVTLTKRVDWASPQLFQSCIQAAMNSTIPPRPLKETTDDGVVQDATGIIGSVTVDVCRPAGGEKVTAVQVIYSQVTITRYAISLSAPEPAESITFEFKAVKFRFFSVDPETGELVEGGVKETDDLTNLEGDESSSATGSSGAADESSGGGSDGGGSGASGGGAGGGTASPAVAPASAVGSPSVPGAAPDPTITVNYPGLWQGTGFGLLPD